MKTWRPRRKWSVEPVAIDGLVNTVMGRLGGEERAREHRAFDAWERSAGEVLRQRSEPEALRGTTLFVRASSSAVAHQITLLRGEILEKMTALLGPDLVTELRTRTGPLRSGD